MKRQKTSRRRVVATMCAVMAVVTATAVAHVWTHLQVIEYGYRISKATRVRDRLLEQNRRLRMELAMLKDPARVAKVAAEEFGLRPTEPGQLRRLHLGPQGGSPADDDRPLRVAPAAVARDVSISSSELLLANRLVESGPGGGRPRAVRDRP